MRLVLPSNSSANYYPENTLGDYSVRLPHEVNLRGPYEVGLEEISFLQSWYNVSDLDDAAFTIERVGFTTEVARIPAGYYSTPEAFAE
jgi:hypothetical protein